MLPAIVASSLDSLHPYYLIPSIFDVGIIIVVMDIILPYQGGRQSCTLTLTQLPSSHIRHSTSSWRVRCFIAAWCMVVRFVVVGQYHGVVVADWWVAHWVAVGCTLGCSWVAHGLQWVALGSHMGCTMGCSVILPLYVNIFLFFLPTSYLRHI